MISINKYRVRDSKGRFTEHLSVKDRANKKEKECLHSERKEDYREGETMEIDEERKKRVINKLNWVIEIFNSKIDAKKMSYYCPNDGEIETSENEFDKYGQVDEHQIKRKNHLSKIGEQNPETHIYDKDKSTANSSKHTRLKTINNELPTHCAITTSLNRKELSSNNLNSHHSVLKLPKIAEKSSHTIDNHYKLTESSKLESESSSIIDSSLLNPIKFIIPYPQSEPRQSSLNNNNFLSYLRTKRTQIERHLLRREQLEKLRYVVSDFSKYEPKSDQERLIG